MDEQLRLLILDDERKGVWDDVLSMDNYKRYMDCTVLNRLDEAIQFLSCNRRSLHIVFSDFRLDGNSGDVTHLENLSFKQHETRAMGANITLFAEGLRAQPGSGCTILVNKLYTVAQDYLNTYSLESHLLSNYYLPSEGFLYRIESDKLTHNDARALLEGALLEIQRFMFRHAETAGGVLRKLHYVLNQKLAADYRMLDLDDGPAVESFRKGLTGPGGPRASLKDFKNGVKGLLEERLTVRLDGTTLTFPLAALFPRLHHEFDEYLKYHGKRWTRESVKDLRRLLRELETVQGCWRDKTQRLGMFLHDHGLLRYSHVPGHRLGRLDETLKAAEQESFGEVFNLRETLVYLSENYDELEADPGRKEAYLNFFKSGEALADEPVLAGLAARGERPFLGYRLDENILEQLLRHLGAGHRELSLKKDTGRTYESPTNAFGGLGDRVFTDKDRLFRAVGYILTEAGAHAYPDAGGEVLLSYVYDPRTHCAKLILEDFGAGMSEQALKRLGSGSPDDGGWAGALHELKEWVEDIWVISKDSGDGDRKPCSRALVRGRQPVGDERINESKDTKGTKVVILFNLISDLSS